MARLVVIASPGLADGFRMAGAPTLGVAVDDAPAILRRVVAEPDVGVVLVTSDLWIGLDQRTRDAIERLGRPLVAQVPVGELAEVVGGRAVIEEMLQRAIGFRADFSGAASRGAGVRTGEP